jgi:hypothetical protein
VRKQAKESDLSSGRLLGEYFLNASLVEVSSGNRGIPSDGCGNNKGVVMMEASSNGTSLWGMLDLPPVEPPLICEDWYGALTVAANYCGFKELPRRILGTWAHGWCPSNWPLLHPDELMGDKTSPAEMYWVARKDEEEYLRNCGYAHVKAIGLPIVYVRRPPVRRRLGSLLVMPAHSLDYTTHQWRFDEYAEQIDAIRTDFSTVVVCIHPSCWKKGYWVDSFRKRGFTLVQGALGEDRNALLRICTLLTGFEFVTTNAFGSHIAYGSYLGAKVSVYGTCAEFINTLHYQQDPQLLGPNLQNISETSLRKHWPELFCHPREAKERVEWGRREVGDDNRVSSRRLRSLFGWGWGNRLMRRLASLVPSPIKHVLKLAARPGYRQELRNRKKKKTELN